MRKLDETSNYQNLSSSKFILPNITNKCVSTNNDSNFKCNSKLESFKKLDDEFNNDKNNNNTSSYFPYTLSKNNSHNSQNNQNRFGSAFDSISSVYLVNKNSNNNTSTSNNNYTSGFYSSNSNSNNNFNSNNNVYSNFNNKPIFFNNMNNIAKNNNASAYHNDSNIDVIKEESNSTLDITNNTSNKINANTTKHMLSTEKDNANIIKNNNSSYNINVYKPKYQEEVVIPDNLKKFSYDILLKKLKDFLISIDQNAMKPINFWLSLRKLSVYLKEMFNVLIEMKELQEKIQIDYKNEIENYNCNNTSDDLGFNNYISKLDSFLKNKNSECEIIFLKAVVVEAIGEIIAFSFKKPQKQEDYKSIIKLILESIDNNSNNNKNTNDAKNDNKPKSTQSLYSQTFSSKKVTSNLLKKYSKTKIETKQNKSCLISTNRINAINFTIKVNINDNYSIVNFYIKVNTFIKSLFKNSFYNEFFVCLNQVLIKLEQIEKDYNANDNNSSKFNPVSSLVFNFYKRTIYDSILVSIYDPKKQYYMFSSKTKNQDYDLMPKAPFLKVQKTTKESMNKRSSYCDNTSNNNYNNRFRINIEIRYENNLKHNSIKSNNSINDIALSKTNSINTNIMSNLSSNSSNLVPHLNSNLLNMTPRLTLILDLDECLIHTIRGENGLCFLQRPYLKTFLEELNKNNYELGIFTSSAQDYAEPIMEIIGNNYFEFGLYRQHCFNADKKVKDLSKVGRDLKHVVFVDNCLENFSLQNDNSFLVSTWEGDIFDSQLKGLLKVLIFIKECYYNSVGNVYDNKNNKETNDLTNKELEESNSINIKRICFNDKNEIDVREIIKKIKEEVSYSFINKSKNPYQKISFIKENSDEENGNK